jgi:hypothetical protein
MAGASETKEETISTFTTIAQLARLTDRELDILFRTVTDRLAGCREGTPERREALAIPNHFFSYCRTICRRFSAALRLVARL